MLPSGRTKEVDAPKAKNEPLMSSANGPRATTPFAALPETLATPLLVIVKQSGLVVVAAGQVDVVGAGAVPSGGGLEAGSCSTTLTW